MKRFCFSLFFLAFVMIAPDAFAKGIGGYPVKVCGDLSFDRNQMAYLIHPFKGPSQETLIISILVEDGYISFTADLRAHFNDGPSIRSFCIQGYLKKNGNLLGFRGTYYLDRSGFSVGN